MIIRQIDADELELLREIDVSESDDVVYVLRDGQLATIQQRWTRPRWDEQECRLRTSVIRQRMMLGDSAFGAFAGASLVGLTVIRPHLDEDRSQLSGLWVNRQHRRQGIGTALTEVAERLSQGVGARQLYVSACPSRSAVGFYLSRGFSLTTQLNPELLAMEPEDIHMTRSIARNTPA